MGITSSKWTAGKGRRPFAPRRWAGDVLVGFKRVMVVMFSAGEVLGGGSGGVKGRGEGPGGGDWSGSLTLLGGVLGSQWYWLEGRTLPLGAPCLMRREHS